MRTEQIQRGCNIPSSKNQKQKQTKKKQRFIKVFCIVFTFCIKLLIYGLITVSLFRFYLILFRREKKLH